MWKGLLLRTERDVVLSGMLKNLRFLKRATRIFFRNCAIIDFSRKKSQEGFCTINSDKDPHTTHFYFGVKEYQR
jgi:hypothetical protein